MDNGVSKLTKHISIYAMTLLFVFICFYYLVPLFLSSFLQDRYGIIYRGFENRYNFLYLPITIFFTFLLDNFLPNKNNKSFFLRSHVLTNLNLNLILSIIYLMVSINFFLKFSINFRHNTESTISNSGFSVMLLFLLTSYFKVILIYFIVLCSKRKLLKKEIYILLLLGLSFTLNLTSSLGVIPIGVCLFLISKNGSFFYENTRKSFTKKILRAVLITFLCISVVFIGNANKIGVDSTYDKFTNVNNLKDIIFSTSSRISTFYISLLRVPEVSINEGNSFSYKTINGIISNLNYRICVISGSNCGNRPKETWSVNRMNYTQIYNYRHNTKDITGSSPGLFASAFYLPWFPLNILFMSFYLVVILRIFTNVFSFIKKKPNLFFFISLMFLSINLFDSPVDIINFINPAIIFFIFFFSLPKALILDEKKNWKKFI